MKRLIRLRGLNGDVEGKVWESDTLLRTGRLESLEVVLDDSSVSRRHAELRATDHGWQLRDLGSTNGTFLNGIRLGADERRLREKDIVQCGKMSLVVDALGEEEVSPAPPTPAENLMVEATTSSSWEDALAKLTFDSRRGGLRTAEQLQALIRASHHLVSTEDLDDLLHSILNDVVNVLDAQRGAIVLAEPGSTDLQLRALATGRGNPSSRFNFSHKLANRTYTRGESILCCSVGEDPDLATAQSIHEGAMASVLCVLLRTPRTRLGVLHLDRSYWQKPFSKEDLELADALAASVSAGIESGQLLQKQRDLFFNTVMVMAQAVEMRDPYTGGHTMRVTRYSQMLAEQLNVSPEDHRLIRMGTPLHDIGKIGIDDAILRKPGKLTPEEYTIMKSHTVKGAGILATVPDLEPMIPIARSHHEQWNGQGYPDGLAGEKIPRLARIVAVADAFDAMTSDRPYRKGLPAQVAFDEVRDHTGKQFDPECAAAFLAIQERITEEMKHHATKVPLIEGLAQALQAT